MSIIVEVGVEAVGCWCTAESKATDCIFTSSPCDVQQWWMTQLASRTFCLLLHIWRQNMRQHLSNSRPDTSPMGDWNMWKW